MSGWAKRLSFLGAAAAAGLALAFVIGGLNDDDPPTRSGPLTAAIVDQAGLTNPNPALADSATRTLEQAGYLVDYIPSEQVTVNFYRDLPKLGYDLLIMRTHSGFYLDFVPRDDAFLFTSEPYSDTEHLDDQRAKRLIKASVYTEGRSISLEPTPTPEIPNLGRSAVQYYFGIPVEFIRKSMRGDFQGATVIVMGCNGLSSEGLAKALVDRGAGQVLSWDGLVSAQHVDAATTSLLDLLITAGLPIADAVAQTMQQVGPDPEYGSVLRWYQP